MVSSAGRVFAGVLVMGAVGGALPSRLVLAQPSVPPAKPAPTAAPSSTPVAAPADGARAAGDPDAPSEAKREEARAHFERGVALSRESAWAPALAEFLHSRKLYPTRTATQNAALLLRKLERFDEALDMYETLLRDFSNVPADDRVAAQRSMVELKGLVGTIDLDGAEVGAAILVDGASRGDYPPASPIRVPAGTHIVRLYKEGFEPFEGRVDVPGGELTRVKVRLRTLRQVGRLKVTEQSGKQLDVLVDGVVVGQTPWEGPLAEGAHAVVLRGEGRIGTQPASAPVREKQVTPLMLLAEELPATLRVSPTPAGATIAIDSVVVGRGFWEGWLKTGQHRVEVASEGFVSVERPVALDAGRLEVVSVELTRDAGSPLWRKPPKIVVDVAGAFALAPSLGGDVAGGCGSGCSRGVGVGGHVSLQGTYELGSGFGLGLSAGYLSVAQSVRGRAAAFRPTGLPTTGSVDDELAMRGMTVGAVGSVVVGERTPLTIRLGAGAFVGSVRDQRQGSFTTTLSHTPYQNGPASASPGATYFYVAPELRLGRRLGEHAEIGVGMKALLLVGSSPRWDASLEQQAAGDGIGTYPDEALAGRVVVVLLPGIGGRYDF